MIDAFAAATQPKVRKISPYLFIFDLDGTLFDTEYDISDLTARLANDIGLKVTTETVFKRLSGKDSAEKFELIALMNDETLKPEQMQALCAAHQAGKVALLDNPKLPLVYGAQDLLRTLKKEGHILAVGTNNNEDLAIRALKHTRLLDFFEDRIYTPGSVGGKSKPDPAMYLKALADLKTPAGNALVIDDSLAGVAAAQAAGIASFGYADPRYGRRIDARRRDLEQAGATLTVETLIDIHTLLLARTLPSRMNKPGFSLD